MAEKTTPVSDISTTNAVAVVKNETAWDWIKDNAYLWAWLPAGIALSVALIVGYNKVTGRAPVDELPIGVAGNLVLVLVAIVLSVAFYRLVFPRIDTTKAGVPWWQVIAIYLIKLWLLAFFWYSLSHG